MCPMLVPCMQEVNSVEAMKSAVQIGLGAAFVSAAVVEKEASLGTLAALRIEGLPLQRQLQCILDPSRWDSKVNERTSTMGHLSGS